MRKSSFPFIIFIILVVFTIIVFFFWNFQIFSQVKSAILWTTYPVTPLFLASQGSALRSHLRSQETALQEENQKLAKQLVDQQKLQKEIAALRDQFQTQNPSLMKILPARIIGKPSFIPGVSSAAYLVIDKGKSDGIENGLPVIYKDSLVGKISNVSDTFSQVMLVTDTAFSTTAKSLESNNVQSSNDILQAKNEVLGVVRGTGSGLVLDNVVLSENLKKGNIIATYGNIDKTGRGFLPDIIIGKIASVDKKPSSLFQKAIVISYIDISKLTTVFIVLPLK